MRESEIFRSFRDPKLPNERFYYVSWYMKYHVPGEGTELIYLFPKSIPPTEPSRVFLAYLEISMTHDSYDSPCLYPPSGAFHLANADRILRFDANGRRIGDPDWPIRMTVMAIVFEAIQVVGEKFGLRLSQSEGFESQSLVASMPMTWKSYPTALTSVNSISLMIPSHCSTHVTLYRTHTQHCSSMPKTLEASQLLFAICETWGYLFKEGRNMFLGH